MRITKISVTGLFGMFDHEIPLNQESRITIVHGPNGVGKTVLMRMVHGLFHFGYTRIAFTPYDEFRIDFDCGNHLKISTDSGEFPSHPRLLIFCRDGLGSDSTSYSPIATGLPFAEQGEKIREQLSGYWRLGSDGQPYHPDEIFRNESDGSYVKLQTIIEQDSALETHLYGRPPDWFARLKQNSTTCLIETQRLLVSRIDDSVIPGSDFLPPGAEPVFTLDKFAIEEVSESFADRVNSFPDELLLFEELINQRLLFKTISIGVEGISITAEDGTLVQPSELSSGEQHLMTLYHQLLFEIEPDTLVMIDEPELSMNVVWQRNFLNDLQRIVELRKFDVLIATHSPMIIHDKWDWMVALGEKVDD